LWDLNLQVTLNINKKNINLTHRKFKEDDAKVIANFPKSEEELFYMFPKANYPLTIDTITNQSKKRFYPTTVLMNSKIVGYGNFIEAIQNDFCSIGNIIINPNYRNTGIASYLINQLTSIAFDKFNVKYIKISCFSTNTPALLLYNKLGFMPKNMIEKISISNNKVLLINMHKDNRSLERNS
jgi:ribosomal protein S18 acetylase RimI-like enzyme